MKAILLAAGLGTRLRPLTDEVPKCLIPIGGRPQLAYWFDLLVAHGVDQVLVNTHHLAPQVEAYVAKAEHPLSVTLTYEPELLGSAGTLLANRSFWENEDSFLVGYADTLINADLGELWETHRRLNPIVTLGLFRAENPSACGIAELDEDGIIRRFVEKPKDPVSDLAFGGVLIGSPELAGVIPEVVPCDLGKDVLGTLAGRMAGHEMVGAYVRDIGTHESLRLAQEELDRLRVGQGYDRRSNAT